MRARLFVLLFVVASGCAAAPADSTTEPPQPPSTTSALVAPVTPDRLVDSAGAPIPPAPQTPDGPLDAGTVEAIAAVWERLRVELDTDAVIRLGTVDDLRVAWLISDLLRFFQAGREGEALVAAFNELTGATVVLDGVTSPWKTATDLLIAWDVPAPPDYLDYKRRVYLLVEPRWEPFFTDTEADVDWRLVTWGGVRIDDRPLGDPDPCPLGCIPALDDPAVTGAGGGSWYPDDAVVFAVSIGGEARAYPKNIMEVHEMVNDTLGGRRVGMPYCTLCGSAQAYLTDAVPEGVDTPVLRTSGLLARSNKVMYDLETGSMFDTFLGVALTGPLREAGVVLEPVTVITTTWGEWKSEHPDTTIVAADGGIGRSYSDDPLRGRDDAGPIFPVGDVDPRLPVQEQVLGVVTPEGTAIAFPAAATRRFLRSGSPLMVGDLEVVLDGGGLRVVTADGDELASHQAFWFAWSQFRPDTLVWRAPS